MKPNRRREKKCRPTSVRMHESSSRDGETTSRTILSILGHRYISHPVHLRDSCDCCAV